MAESTFVGKMGLRPFDAAKAMLLRTHLIPDHFLILLTITHDPAMRAIVFISGIEDEILDLAKWAVAPCLQFLIQQLGGAADLRR